MARGRKPTPAAVKKARGNPSKRKAKTKEPVSRVGVSAPPDFISPEARVAWLYLRPKLEAMGLLTEADEVAFTALCEAVGEWRIYRKMLNEDGGRIKPHPTKKGAFLYNPVGFVDKIEKRMQGWMMEFGLTPSSRSRVTRTEPQAEVDPFAEYDGQLVGLPGGKK